jgi:hypothetical protein
MDLGRWREIATDAATVVLVGLWMGWTFEAIQSQGATIGLIGAALIFGVVGLLAIHGQRVTYIRLGDRVAVGLEAGRDEPETGTDDGEERRRTR